MDSTSWGAPSQDHRDAWQTLAHDEDSSRFNGSSLLRKVTVITKARHRSGPDDTKVVQALVAVYGQAKTSVLRRWMRVSKTVDMDLVKFISREKAFSQSCIFDNPCRSLGVGREGSAMQT